MEDVKIFEIVFDFNIEDNYDYSKDDNRKEAFESLAD